ncbi:endonuclease/exonuclease/phosphatase family protein [Planococcus liqunii]|uniref:endonuclease/exonuclease/phosphatase family protein n=1 Tax=Planococcus liqunii TaxID=3058394 RepID=UPI00260E2502|nr:endonuclease/exonuclease/phosphatase family protein [Planococcus sp. N056]WKA51251.1 endonuclease/exonuclease/phosphatase family protein [Planococcus sp. N056]
MLERGKEPLVSVKVMSFNIAHGLGMNGIVDLEKTAGIIEDSCAHIVALQEVDRCFSERSAFADQVQWLSERLGMQAVFGANLDFEPVEADGPRRQYGNAILSKHPIKYSENHLLTQVLTDFGKNEQRGILEAVIEIKGNLITVYNTHLALEEEELKVSIGELVGIIEKRSFPRIVLGDFNALPRDGQIKRLNRHLSDAFLKLKRGDAYTYPAPYQNAETGENFKPITRIDYIFADPELDPVQVAVMETDVSDHLPIAADFVVTPLQKPLQKPAQTAFPKVIVS